MYTVTTGLSYQIFIFIFFFHFSLLYYTSSSCWSTSSSNFSQVRCLGLSRCETSLFCLLPWLTAGFKITLLNILEELPHCLLLSRVATERIINPLQIKCFPQWLQNLPLIHVLKAHDLGIIFLGSSCSGLGGPFSNTDLRNIYLALFSISSFLVLSPWTSVRWILALINLLYIFSLMFQLFIFLFFHIRVLS